MPWRHDIGYPQFRVLVELDGRLGHEGQSRVADTRRDRGNAAAGWLTLRAGWLDVTTAPWPLAAEVGAVPQQSAPMPAEPTQPGEAKPNRPAE